MTHKDEWSSHVTKIWERKPDPSQMTPKEFEQVYRFHYTHVDTADEQTLYYHIHRHMRAGVLTSRWFVLLLSQFPTDRNYDMFLRAYPPQIKKFKSTLIFLIELPTISCETLRLILRRTTPTKKQSKINRVRKRVQQRLVERELDSFDAMI